MILVDLYDLSNLDVFPRFVLESMRLLVDSLNSLVILNVVFRASLQVLKQILKHGDEYNWNQS